ncbi:hypothetical protein Tco_0870761 [Tanacetum coccineum]
MSNGGGSLRVRLVGDRESEGGGVGVGVLCEKRICTRAWGGGELKDECEVDSVGGQMVELEKRGCEFVYEIVDRFGVMTQDGSVWDATGVSDSSLSQDISKKLFTSRLGPDLILRFLGSIPRQKLYLHFQLWDLYCMKLNVGDVTLGTPWLLGKGDTDRHIGVTESYGRTRVGYERFQVAVDDVIGCFKKQTGKDIKKLKGDRTWRGILNFDLTSILYMSIEPVRFRWLSTDYHLT